MVLGQIMVAVRVIEKTIQRRLEALEQRLKGLGIPRLQPIQEILIRRLERWSAQSRMSFQQLVSYA